MGEMWSCFKRQSSDAKLARQTIDDVCRDDPKTILVEIDRKYKLPKSDIHRLLRGLRNNTHLQILYLVGLGLNDEDGLMLCCALDKCNLQHLDVRNNNLTGYSIVRMLRSVTRRDDPKLLTLRIGHQSQVKRTEQDQQEIEEWLAKNKTLHLFELDHYEVLPAIKGRVQAKLPATEGEESSELDMKHKADSASKELETLDAGISEDIVTTLCPLPDVQTSKADRLHTLPDL